MKQIILDNFGVFLATLATAFGGWFFGRKKAAVDADSVQIENYDKGLVYFQKIVDSLGNQLEKAIQALEKTEREKQEVILKFSQATEQIHELERKVEKLTEELSKYKQLNGKI